MSERPQHLGSVAAAVAIAACAMAPVSASASPLTDPVSGPASGTTASETASASESASSSETASGSASESESRSGTASASASAPASASASASGAASPPSDGPSWLRARARYDAVIGFSSRYRLDTATDPLGLEQQLWRRVDVLPFYHRLSVDGALRLDEGITLSLHFSGWGTANLLADEGGGVAAGDVVLGYLELAVGPAALWAGRRFVAYGPPGGLQIDGGGVSVRSTQGLFADAFVGRPVTPARSSLLGPEPSFEGVGVAYGARVGYDDPGVFAASAGYAEVWGRGMLGSRTVDVASTWDPGPVAVEGGIKLDVMSPAVVMARLALTVPILRELSLDADYLHLEPGRWIPVWSILSAFETSTFDEASVGATVRVTRTFSVRAEGAARFYTGEVQGSLRAGYRADLVARLVPGRDRGPTLRVLASRRDDGVVGYTLVTAGVATDLLPEVVVLALDGALALDDTGGRVSLFGRASLDATPGAEWTIGATASLGQTPTTDTDIRAMLRARWAPEVR